MAKVYRSVNGKKLTKMLATLPGVQRDLEERTFAMASAAEKALISHHHDGHAQIEVDHENVDWFVVLSDERGQRAALSIEYGRAAGEYEVRNQNTGTVERKKFGASDGLYILAEATHLPKKRKGKVKL